MNCVYNKDARSILSSLQADVEIQSTITSPPYFDMKDYGSENQIGYGQTYDNYLDDLQNIFKDIYKITKKDGTLWIIIDTFKRNNQVITLPFDLANRLKSTGWLLQDIIIWKKDKTVPWSTNGFMQRKFEYILFFTKSTKYKANKDSVRTYDTTKLKNWWIKYPERYNPKGKALDEVWEFPIPVQGSWGDQYVRHFCPLPKEMVAQMIQISTDENDIILDPFAGSGAVLSQAAFMKRNYIGFELNPEYIKMFETYLENNFDSNSKLYEANKDNSQQKNFETTILNLRALKFGRILVNKLEKQFNRNNIKIYVHMVKDSIVDNIKSVTYKLLNVERTELVESTIKEIITKPPLSKFGINAHIEFIKINDISPENFYYYSKTNTYSFLINTDINSDKVKIISNIEINISPDNY